MKVYPTSKIRNIALVSHTGAGKTTFVERMLYATGAITRMGSVSNGNTVTDFEPEELDRQSSISTSLAAIEFRDGKLNLFDTPGYMDFVGEVNAALHVADSAVVFVEGVSGVEVGTEIVYQIAKRQNLPTLLVVSKMDRDNTRVTRVLNSINDHLLDERRLIKLQIPIGEGPTFKGVIDLVNEAAFMGEKGERAAIPERYAEEVEEARMELIEAAAEGDDELMEKYFEEDTLSADDIIRGLQGAMEQNIVVPITYCAAESGVGTDLLARTMQRLLPAPGIRGGFKPYDSSGERVEYAISNDSPLAAFVFKTREDKYGKTSYVRVFGGVLESDSRVWDVNLDSEVRIGQLGVVVGKDLHNVSKLNAGDVGAVVKLGDTATNHTLTDRSNLLKVIKVQQPNPIFSYAIHPVSQSDVGKLSEALSRLMEEDSTLMTRHDAATHETILSGMGDVHLSMAVKKLQSKFGVNVETTTPKIPYRETIMGESSAEHTHKKQSGGAGQYGRVMLRVESINDDDEFEFGSEIYGGSISGPFVVATEKGCLQAVEKGPIAGYPVTGVKAVVYDGKMHPVDSKEIAFQIAGRESFRKAMMKAKPTLLEPLYNVTVTVPAENMGDIMSDMNTRRAHVQGMEQIGSRAVIKAEVPLAEMQRYLVDLRSMTAGRGVYGMQFSRYGRVPNHMKDKIVEAAKAEAA